MVDIFSILIVVMVSQVFAYVQTHQDVHIKCVLFFMYKLYLNIAKNSDMGR